MLFGRLRNILSIFSLVSPEKQAPKEMQEPGIVVTPIFSRLAFKDTIANLLFVIKENTFESSRLQDLHDCHVELVEHLRLRIGAHECILLTVAHANNPNQKRYIRLDRYQPANGILTNRSSPALFDLSSDMSRLVKGKDTGNADHAVIHDSRDKFNCDYQVVRSFVVPGGFLNILEALCLGSSLTTLAGNYSLLHHMCMWWATNFFLASYDIVSSKLDLSSALPINDGPGREDGGRFLSFKLVNERGQLSLPGHGHESDEEIIVKMTRHLAGKGLPQDEIERTESVIRADFRNAADDKSITIKHAVSVASVLLDETERDIESKVRRTKQRDLAEQRALQAEEARKLAESSAEAQRKEYEAKLESQAKDYEDRIAELKKQVSVSAT